MNAPPTNALVSAIGSPWRAFAALVIVVATLVVTKLWPTAGMVLTPVVLVSAFFAYRWLARRLDDVQTVEHDSPPLHVVREVDDE